MKLKFDGIIAFVPVMPQLSSGVTQLSISAPMWPIYQSLNIFVISFYQ